MIQYRAMNDWREWLYIPLGLLPALFFSSRFIIQWIRSEKEKKSVVPPVFWRLSLAGNLLQLTHYCVQLQFPFAIIQATNAVISWRNLDFMRKAGPRGSFKRTLILFFCSVAMVTGLFALQESVSYWMRIPQQPEGTVASAWHVAGAVGGILFASRFWLQWWHAECSGVSRLSTTFWWLSIAGSILTLCYFVRIGDSVSLLYSCFGLIPYVRNLILLRREEVTSG